MAESKKVGQVNFEVRADTSKLAGDLDAAQIQAQVQASKASLATSAATPASTIASSAGKLSGFIGKLGLIGVVATIGVKAGILLRETWDAFFTSGTEKAKKFKEALDLSDMKGSTKAIQKEYEDLANQLANSLEGGFVNRYNTLVAGQTTAGLKEQLKSLEQTRKSLAQATRAGELRELREKLAKEEKIELEATEKRIEAKRIALLDGEEKMMAEAERDRQSITDKILATQNEDLKASLILESELLSRKLEADVKAYREAEDEKLEAAKERAEKESEILQREANRARDIWDEYIRGQQAALQQLMDTNNRVMGVTNMDANAGNIGLILTTLSAQMAGMSESMQRSVKTSPYE